MRPSVVSMRRIVGPMRRAPALVLLALAAALAAAPAPRAQQPSPAQAALDAVAAPLYQQLAALKGIASPGPPPVLLRSRAENRRLIEQEIARRYAPAVLEAEPLHVREEQEVAQELGRFPDDGPARARDNLALRHGQIG